MRFRHLLAPLLAACAAILPAAAQDASIRVELLAADTPAATPPASSPTVLSTQGSAVEVVLPYREQGTWLRITLASLPAEPRLVVNGVAVGKLVLVLPDGRRIERDKNRPAGDAAASMVAAVFELPASMSAGSTLWLHSSDQHRNLIDLRVLSASQWRERERIALAFAFTLYGALAAFIILAATYWTILRERMFADHALYLFSLLLFMAATSGVFYAAFNGGLWSRLGIQGQWGFATAAVAFAVGFANRFIDVARYLPRTARGLDALRSALIALAVAVTVSPIPTPYFGALMALAVVAINLTLVGLGVFVATKRNRYARYFLLGWIPLTLCTNLRALQGTGLVEIRYEISFFYALGAIWEALVLTAGIADRALSFRRERDLAQHAAEHDGLTGVLNRRASQARLDELFRRARASDAPLGILFLDLDQFKSINDRHGHAAGDAVLVATSRRIAAQLRADDVLGRWGGEEFVAILPGAPLDAVRATGERIRRAVESSPVNVDADRIAVTVSVGFAMLDARSKDGAEMLQRADDALYRAKDKGRNRVEEALLPA
jgi:diguanylate cyclase (GGDEF)-like protein